MAKVGSYRWEGKEKIRKGLEKAAVEEISEAAASLCYSCGSEGIKVGEDYVYDILHCTVCHAEWLEVN